MATRSTIGMLLPTTNTKGNKFDAQRPCVSIYCHNDGYLEHNGILLDIFYRDPQVVKEMMSLGACSSLGYTLGTKHDFNKRSQGDEYYDSVRFMSCFYHRDRDGIGGTKEPLEYYKGVLGEMPLESWVYLYVPEEKEWYVLENNKWMNLHKRIYTVMANANDFMKPLSHSVNPKDKVAVNKLKAYGNAFTEYRNKHPYIPPYYKLKDDNDTREYYCKQGFGGEVHYAFYRVIKINKTNKGKTVTFELIGNNRKATVSLEEFLEIYFREAGMILKNPSIFTAHLPK